MPGSIQPIGIRICVALSACPALASRVLRSGSGLKREDGRLTGIQAGYYRLLQRAVQMPLVVLALAIAITGGAALFYEGLPRELAPSEDRGVGFIPLTSPQGSTVEHTDLAARQVEAILEPMREEGLIDTVFTFTGWGNRAWRSFVVFRLVPWEERTVAISDVVGRIVPQMSQVTIARGFPVTPAGLGLRGNSTPVRVVIGGPDFDSVKEWSTTLLARSESIPGLVNPEINFEENLPQLDVSIDRNRADDLGISIDTIANTLQTMLASREVTTFVSRGREYPVILQAAEIDRESAHGTLEWEPKTGLPEQSVGTGVRVVTHTIVPSEIGGRGIAALLVERIVADAREEGFRIEPQCSYVAKKFDEHPEWADLLAKPLDRHKLGRFLEEVAREMN